MKIGFVGSHGTGKTTLASYLVHEHPDFQNFGLVTSGIRRSNKIVRVNKEASMYDQLLSVCARIADEALLWPGQDIISDRTPLDSLAYSKYQAIHQWSDATVDAYMDIYEGLVKACMDYDLLVYFPVYWPPEDDGVRSADPMYQKEIAALTSRYLSKFRLDYVIMENAPVERRAENLSRWLRRKD